MNMRLVLSHTYNFSWITRSPGATARAPWIVEAESAVRNRKTVPVIR
jgi:hypothetical protein